MKKKQKTIAIHAPIFSSTMVNIGVLQPCTDFYTYVLKVMAIPYFDKQNDGFSFKQTCMGRLRKGYLLYFIVENNLAIMVKTANLNLSNTLPIADTGEG